MRIICRDMASTGGVLLLALTLTACSFGGTAKQHHSQPAQASEQTPTPTRTPTPTPASEVLTYNSADADGYTYQLTMKIPDTVSIAPDVASQKPGEVALGIAFPMDGQFTNTTSARNTPVGSSSLIPVWGPNSAVCNAQASSEHGSWMVLQRDQAPTGYCVVAEWPIAFQDQRQRRTLNPSESAAAGLNTSNAAPQGVSLVVPEAQQTAISAELSHPAFWALSGNSSDPSITEAAGICFLKTAMGADFIIASTNSAGSAICKAHTPAG